MTSLASLVRQVVDADDLHGQIVRTALPVGLFDDGLGGAVQIGAAAVDSVGDEVRVDVFVDAVRRQHEDVASFERHGTVVDFDLLIHAQRAAEIALLRRDDDAVILGELFQALSRDPVDAGVADVKNVRRGRSDHQCS